MVFFKFEPFADLFWLFSLHMHSWFREEGWKYFCRFSLLLYFKIQTSWTNLNSRIYLKLKIINWLYTFFNLQNHPTLHPEERLVNLERGRGCFVCLSILLVYAWVGPAPHWMSGGWPHSCQNHAEGRREKKLTIKNLKHVKTVLKQKFIKTKKINKL